MVIEIQEIVDDLTASAIDLLRKLVRFDTTSTKSNWDLIEFVSAYLLEHGIQAQILPNADGTKANLLATLGTGTEGGVILSGHTDVVPVTGQNWTSDPFSLHRRGARLFGRGTADMKGFIACALAAVPLFVRRGLPNRPIHLTLTYDEEVGCLGAPTLIDAIRPLVSPSTLVIVGEPTDMGVVSSHKGLIIFDVTVVGFEAHSSLTHMGLSANALAIKLMNRLMVIAGEREAHGVSDRRFEPAYSTLTIGIIHGGTATNILARECRFGFDLRCVPGDDPDEILADFYAEADSINAEIVRRFPHGGVRISKRASVPPLAAEEHGAAEALVRSLTGDDRVGRAAAYGAEAGQFQQAEFSTVLCGPGSIEQAHQPDEYIEMEQIQKAMRFMLRLAEGRLAPGATPGKAVDA